MAEVDLLVRRAAERRRLERDRVASESMSRETAIVTRWPPLQAIVQRVTEAAPTLGAMLVRGEPGTGRTTLARHAHHVAGGGPFVEIDGTLSGERQAPLMATRIAAAVGGTLYVRAVDVLAVDVQRLLGRAFGAMPGLRLVAATASTPDANALDATLREHLSSVEAALPPLREREGDVPLLAESFVRRYGGATAPALGDAAIDRLVRHAWPGNVAELRLVMEGAVARAAANGDSVVEPQHLGLDSVPQP
jgi:DNA-binding NtrC family response regulator